MQRSTWKAHLALFIVNALYGAGHILAKGVMPAFLTPTTFIFFRILGATLLFWIIKAFVPKERIQRKDIGLFMLCALFGVTVNQLFFEQAQLIASMLGSLKEKPSLTPSLSFFKPEPVSKRLVTLPDGNCAFNGIALFLRDGFLNLAEDNPHLPHWLEMLQANEGMEEKRIQKNEST